MQRISLAFSAIMAAAACIGFAASDSGPYKVLKTAKVGGAGGFDYVYADAGRTPAVHCAHRHRARITVFNLDTLEPVGEIPNVSAHGAAVSDKSRPRIRQQQAGRSMWDTKTLTPIKTIDMQGGPDGIMYDPSTIASTFSATRSQRHRDQRRGRLRCWAPSIWAARRSRPRPMARDTSTSISRIRATSRWWMPRRMMVTGPLRSDGQGRAPARGWRWTRRTTFCSRPAATRRPW